MSDYKGKCAKFSSYSYVALLPTLLVHLHPADLKNKSPHSKNTDIAAHLKLPPVKLHCSMLAEDAIVAAIKDYKSKQVESGSA